MAPSEKKSKVAHQRKEPRALKRKRELEDLEKLEKAVKELDLKSPDLKNFENLPLCEATTSGLSASHYQVLTDIQARAIPQALKGDDVLGAAKTGSGKTLAFLVPMLEKLYRARWTEYDGLGALIISPTRELAVQIFEVLRKIGRYHVFSAGLVVGGKSLEEEAARLGRMNILVCTPGRLLQHLDQTVGLDVNNLQMLVLDEADRILDTGFQTTVNAIIGHLPKTRQTMLFSATQNKKVSDLARLSLADPVYISVSEGAAASTPNTLQQFYMVTPLPEKLDTLYGFIKANLKSKMIVFMSSAKQVRFVYESFRRLQPGIPLLHLHGRQKQEARLAITDHFRSAKYSCLFATDVVARGVDFPAVDWVVQVDAPEDTDTYIHRVGRTARYESKGRAVLFLDPSEQESMIKKLELKKVPITRVHPREKKKKSIANMLQDLCFKETDVKYLGQKAFISYVRSVHQQKDKNIFKVEELDLDGFAKALGLPGTPPVKLKKTDDQKRLKNVSRDALSSDSEEEKKQPEVRTKYERMAQRTNQDVFTCHYRQMLGDEDAADDDEEDFLSVKRVLNGDQLEEASRQPTIAEPKVVDLGGGQLIIDSHRREKLLKSKKKLAKLRGKGSKMVFDDDGNAHAIYELQDEDDFKAQRPEELRQQFMETEGARVREADLEDKQLAKEKRKEKRMKRKARERGEDMDESGPVALLDAPDELNGEDPLDLLRSLPMPSEGRSDNESEEEEEEQRPKKKPKKWFQDDSDDEKEGGKKVVEIDHEPETLEDFEALAKGLLE